MLLLCLGLRVCLRTVPWWGEGLLRYFVFFVSGESTGLNIFVSSDY